MVLERAAAAVRAVLDRTRRRAPAVPATSTGAGGREDVEVLLDVNASEGARRLAAQRLGPRERARAVVLADGTTYVMDADAAVPGGSGESGPTRAGVGDAVHPLQLPDSLRSARTALRFTAEGTDQDPGARTVYADRLGGLPVLASAVGPGTEPVADVRSVERACAGAPWVTATLHAVAVHPSLRLAAASLTLHHATLQTRLAHTERWLGWSTQTPEGRLRLQLALALRRLHGTA